MSDLRVVAIIAAAEGSKEVARDALSALADASRGEEGCLDYAVFESEAAPGTFVTIEVWRGQADLDAHMESEHIAAAFAAVDGHLAGAPAIHPLHPLTG